MNKAKALFFSLSCLLLLFCFSRQGSAQEPVPSDSEIEAPDAVEEDLVPVPITELDSLGNLPVEVADTALVPVPGIAAFYSAILPGLGQAYNNAHWKIPLIYIGGAMIASSVSNYNKQYSTSVRNLNLIQFNPTITEVNNRDKSYWERRSSFYRRQRDYTIILGGVLYMLTIVEAYVDAHLQDFNVNDDLAVQFKPALMAAGPGGNAGAGIALTLTIK